MALAMGGTSCKKDSKQNAGERMVIGAGINQGGGNGSKTYVGTLQNGEYPVLWGQGDAFDLFSENGTQPQTFSIEDGVGKTSGKFEGIDPGGSKYFGFYPSGTGTRDGNTFTYNVEGIGYADGTCKNAPMFGYSADGKNVMFENVMSWVRIGLKTTEGTVHVTSVSLGAKDNAAVMKGTLTVSFDGEGTITNTAMSGDKHSLTVSTDMTVSTTTQYVSFLVPASNATNWIFTVTSDCGSWTKKSYEKTISGGIERNAIYVGEIEVANSEGNGGGTTYSGDVPGEGGGSEGGGSESTLRVAPDDALPYKFTINADGDYVFFAKGNLWCDASDSENLKWYFEEDQWGTNPSVNGKLPKDKEYCGNTPDPTKPTDFSDGFKSHISHFNWSENCNDAIAFTQKVPSASSTNLFTSQLFDRNWRVLTTGAKESEPAIQCEWQYILGSTRMVNGGDAYKLTTIAGYKGLCLYPDDYSGTYGETTFEELETAGIAFLPVTGARESAYIWPSGTPPTSGHEEDVIGFPENGCYISSYVTIADYGKYMRPMQFSVIGSVNYFSNLSNFSRSYAIRLVHPGLDPTTK